MCDGGRKSSFLPRRHADHVRAMYDAVPYIRQFIEHVSLPIMETVTTVLQLRTYIKKNETNLNGLNITGKPRQVRNNGMKTSP
jgi:hypothetical protein